MEKTMIASGKTIDLAIESALTQLGLDRDSVSVQVIQQAKAGFLGFGAQPAKVQVTYEAPDIPAAPAAPKSALGSASRSKPKAKPAAPKQEAPKAEPVKAAEPKKEAPKQEKKQEKAEKKVEKKVEKTERKQEKKLDKKVEAPAEPKVYTPAEPGSTEEQIETFIKGLLEHMDSTAVPHAWKVDANTYKVERVGDDLGYLIGRRGDTLEAIQHLCNYTVNRAGEGHIRINVDA